MFGAITLSVAAGAHPATGNESGDEPNLAKARDYARAFYAGQVDGLWEAFTDEMKNALGSKVALEGFQAQIDGQFGPETKVLEEHLVDVGMVHDYVRVAEFEQLDQPMVVRLAMQEKGAIAGFTISPRQSPAPSEFEEYATRTRLRLPFEGEWLVFWGGRSVEQNYHAAAPDQRFAYDFLRIRAGRTHRGRGDSLDDYYCFGEPILAPGNGEVVVAVDGQPDQPPGVLDRNAGAGNHIIIDHGDGEFSFLAHLRQDSLRVRAGQSVAAGDVIGECGNSGHSSEPHLHYHLQRDGVFHGGAGGEGLPAQFFDYIAGGNPVDRGEPIRGQVIRPAD